MLSHRRDLTMDISCSVCVGVCVRERKLCMGSDILITLANPESQAFLFYNVWCSLIEKP